MIRDFLVGVYARHRGWGYGFAAFYLGGDYGTIRAGWRFWDRWRHPVWHLHMSWRLRRL